VKGSAEMKLNRQKKVKIRSKVNWVERERERERELVMSEWCFDLHKERSNRTKQADDDPANRKWNQPIRSNLTESTRWALIKKRSTEVINQIN
jgi:hypothetical protein